MKFSRICSLTLTVATFTFSARADITTGLVGYWTADTINVSGSTAIDSSSYRNNGSLVGTPPIVSGKIAQAVDLTTTSQMISVPDSASLNLTGPFTVAVWVNFTALPGSSQYPNVVAKLNSPSSYYGYGLFWYGSGVAGIIGPGSAKWYVTSTYRPTAGVWTHYAAVFDGTYLRLYINGAQYSQVAATAPGTTATIPIKMGPHYSNPSSYGVINGLFDDVRVYNRALAAADITELYGYSASSPCTYALSATSASMSSSGGNGSINVTAGSGCGWSATSGASWITITGGGSGTGNGTVSYSVAANTSTSSRTGTLTVAGQAFTITQNGVCSYAITPTSSSYASSGGSGTVSVTTGGTCFWTATSSASWITISSGSAGTGNGSVYYTVAANTATSSRTGTMTIAGQIFTVSQLAAATVAPDTTPPSVSLTAPGTGSTLSGSVTVSASASDNVGVSKVEFYRDSTVLVGTATAAPYTVSWNTTGTANGSHSLVAKAYDAAGNSSTSGGSTVNVNNGTTSTAGQLQWVNSMLTTRSGVSAMSTGVATDSSGNAIAVGAFNNTTIFGTLTTSSSGGWNSFVAKYTLQGSLAWLKTLGGVGNCYAQGVAVDGQGNIIVVGYFGGTADFGGMTLSAPDPYYTQATDMFVAKYGPTGSLLWVQRFGGNTSAIATGVGIDSSNNILLAGYISSSTSFGSITLSTVANNSLVVAKLSSAGQVLWARSWGSSGSTVQSSGLAVDPTGNVAVTGSFYGNTDIGGGIMSATSGSSPTVFLAKYSGVDGSAQWAKGFGGSGNNAGMSVAVDPTTGNVVVGGGFTGTANFGGGSVTGGAGQSGFLAGYSSSGGFLWVNTFGGTVSGEQSQINAVRIDARGNLAYTGAKGGAWYVGGSWKYSTLLVAGCTISGNAAPTLRWFDVAGSGSTGADSGSALAFDAFGHVIAAGSFYSGTINFGGISATSPSGGYSGWVAQYSN